VSVTFVSCVKTNKDIFEIFQPSGSHTILVLPNQTGWQYSHGNPLTGTSNAGGYAEIAILSLYACCLTLQQAKCCKHGRRWTMAIISQVVTHIAGRILRVFDHQAVQAPRAIKSPSPWFFSARATKRALALYTITTDRVYDSKA